MPHTGRAVSQPVIFGLLGVSVKDGQVRRVSLLAITPRVLGPLAGAGARVAAAGDYGQPAVLITFADGTVYTRATASCARAAVQAAEFNALAGYTTEES